ncbi:MAG: hypothetical protein L0K74_01100 [Acidipropionibacterium acidipropionici]|nr:hypothetical protein [Acidipropionibacterium acidipropionici]
MVMGVEMTYFTNGVPASIDPSRRIIPGLYDPHQVDREALGYAAVLARAFQLGSEEIQYSKVVESLRRFAASDDQSSMIDGLVELWERCKVPRVYSFAEQNKQELIPGGTNNYEIADRTIYSQIAHADDAREILDHITTGEQLWSLEALVGDWIAVIAYQQAVMNVIRPDLVTELTAWAGNPHTIFSRHGIDVDRPATAPITDAGEPASSSQDQ